MAIPLEREKEALERELIDNTQLSFTTKESLKARITEIERKLKVKAGKQTTLKDGSRVGIGDTVYTITPGNVRVDYQGKLEIRKAKFHDLTVKAISSKGEISCSDGRTYSNRHSYLSVDRFYSSKAAAVNAEYAAVHRAIRQAHDEIAKLNLCVTQYELMLGELENEYGVHLHEGEAFNSRAVQEVG